MNLAQLVAATTCSPTRGDLGKNKLAATSNSDKDRDEQLAIPGGNVSGGRNPGAADPLFPRVCAEVSGESQNF